MNYTYTKNKKSINRWNKIWCTLTIQKHTQCKLQRYRNLYGLNFMGMIIWEWDSKNNCWTYKQIWIKCLIFIYVTMQITTNLIYSEEYLWHKCPLWATISMAKMQCTVALKNELHCKYRKLHQMFFSNCQKEEV